MKIIAFLLLAVVPLVGMLAGPATAVASKNGAPVGGKIIIFDSFSGENNTVIKGRTPDKADLPGSAWKTCERAFLTTWAGSGSPVSMAGMSCPYNAAPGAAIAISMAGKGSYAKPRRFAISADFVPGGASKQGPTQPALGFFPAPPRTPVGPSANLYSFTGLSLAVNGTLILYQNGFPGVGIKYAGVFDPKKIHHLSYDVNPETGGISHVRLSGSTSNYDALRNTGAFTNAATAYAGVCIPAGDRDAPSCVGNFKVAVNTKPPAAPATPMLFIYPGNSQVTLRWMATGSYNVYRGAAPGAESVHPIGSVILDTSTYVDRGLVNGATYYYRVNMTNAGGASGYSNEVKATPEKYPGFRIFTCGNSFNGGVGEWLMNTAGQAGVKGQRIVGGDLIGGSYLIQHWGRPDVMKALRYGGVDVMTADGMFPPSLGGIEKFAQLGFANNPNFRLTMMQIWCPFDHGVKFWNSVNGHPGSDPAWKRMRPFDSATVAYLRKLHAPYFKAMIHDVRAINKKLGKHVVFVIPMGQAMIALRARIIAGHVPGVAKQHDLFTDGTGHPGLVMCALRSYCEFAVIYRRSPVGLPIPKEWEKSQFAHADKLNHLLQELAWKAVLANPCSGVKAYIASGNAATK